MIEEQLFTVGEVAEQLRVTDTTVRRWLHRGELPSINVGGQRRPDYRIRRSAIEQFIAGRESKAAA